MLWPSQLVTVSLYQTLHGKDEEDVKETKQRMRFFSTTFTSIFAWQFVPSVIFPTLTSIAVLCLVNNQSHVLRTLGSGYNGFGILDFVSTPLFESNLTSRANKKMAEFSPSTGQ